MLENKTEIERIKGAYERRKLGVPSHLYSFFDQGNLFIIQRREQQILNFFKKLGISDLEGKKILDIGCGTGGELRNLLRYGAKPENLFGIDLIRERIEIAKKIAPNINFRCGDASTLHYEDESFDIVMQFTVFTSILDDVMKRNIANEVLRVLNPDGIILWYDYFIRKPTNPDVKGINRKEIEELFANCQFDLHRVTLAPPIARLLAPYSWLLCYLLEKIPIFRTHYLGVIKKDEKVSKKPKPQARH